MRNLFNIADGAGTDGLAAGASVTWTDVTHNAYCVVLMPGGGVVDLQVKPIAQTNAPWSTTRTFRSTSIDRIVIDRALEYKYLQRGTATKPVYATFEPITSKMYFDPTAVDGYTTATPVSSPVDRTGGSESGGNAVRVWDENAEYSPGDVVLDPVTGLMYTVTGQPTGSPHVDNDNYSPFGPKSITAPLNVAGATTLKLQIKTSDDQAYTVDWGDGTESVASQDNATHTYANPYTGAVTVAFEEHQWPIELNITEGKWSFTGAQFVAFNQYNLLTSISIVADGVITGSVNEHFVQPGSPIYWLSLRLDNSPLTGDVGLMGLNGPNLNFINIRSAPTIFTGSLNTLLAAAPELNTLFLITSLDNQMSLDVSNVTAPKLETLYFRGEYGGDLYLLFANSPLLTYLLLQGPASHPLTVTETPDVSEAMRFVYLVHTLLDMNDGLLLLNALAEQTTSWSANKQVLITGTPGQILPVESIAVIRTIEATGATVTVPRQTGYSASLGVAAGINQAFVIDTYGAVPYTVDWGDGTIENPASGTQATHTYASAYTGSVELTFDEHAGPVDIQLDSGQWLVTAADYTDVNKYGYVESLSISTPLAITGPMTGFVTDKLKHLTINAPNSTTGWPLTDIAPATALETLSLNTGANVSGNIRTILNGFPALAKLELVGQAISLTGNISATSLSNIKQLRVSGNLMQVGGNLDMLSDLTELQVIGDLLEFTGNIETLVNNSQALDSFDLSGPRHQIAGSLSNIQHTALTNLVLSMSLATITGDLALLIAGAPNIDRLLVFVTASGVTVDSAPAFKSAMTEIRIRADMSTESIDNLLAGAATVTGWTGAATVLIGHTTNQPTAAGLAHIPTIQSAGGTVIHP